MKEAYPILTNKGNVLRHSSISSSDSNKEDSYTFKMFSAATAGSFNSPIKSVKSEKFDTKLLKIKINSRNDNQDYSSQIEDFGDYK